VQITLQEFFLLREQLPVIDVRSEGEYEAGHIVKTQNIPLLNNAERILVGTDYKQKGQLEAIKTGFRLVGPRLLQIINDTEKITPNKEAIIHCWRGGMRSSNFCQFVGMAGIQTHQLRGGYKTYRTEALESFKKPYRFYLIGGCTGSGKSEILRALAEQGEQVIDLESLANHKGSVFGGLMQPPQPTTEQFQNNLFEAFRKLDQTKRIWIEDESVAIGKIFLPSDLWVTMGQSPVLEIELSKELRIQRLVAEYGHADKSKFLEAMERIVKKLGGQHFKAAKEQFLAGDMAGTIDILLTYYDKAYHNGLDRKVKRVTEKIEWDGKDVGVWVKKIAALP
jgi:tRNA 2-selenouridine synthase